MLKDNITLFHADYKKINRLKSFWIYVIALLIMFAIAFITYIVAFNVNSNPFYNH